MLAVEAASTARLNGQIRTADNEARWALLIPTLVIVARQPMAAWPGNIRREQVC
jgi:hypothetical protein